MLTEIFWFAFKSLGVLAILCFLTFYYSHVKRVKKIRDFYGTQKGVLLEPGFDAFPLGNIKGILATVEESKRAEREGLDPIVAHNAWVLDQLTDSKAERSHDYAKQSVIVHNWADTFIQVCDPEIVQNMYATKNAQIDKSRIIEGFFQNLFGKSFIFAVTDDKWKQKRKGLGHAFYKDKLIVLLDSLKVYMHEAQKGWLDQIRTSSSSSVQIDMSKEILYILERFLTHVILGAKVDDLKIDIQTR